MAGEITDQQLLDAATDAANLAAIVNGPATGAGSTVALRTGGTALTLRAAAATIAKGDPGAKGDKGDDGVGSLAQLATLRNGVGPTGNRFNQATGQQGKYISTSDGSIQNGSDTTSTISDFMTVDPDVPMCSSHAGWNVLGQNWGAYYAADKTTFVAGFPNTIAAGVPFTPPSTAAFVRITYNTADVAEVMFVAGALPANYLAYGSSPKDLQQDNALATEVNQRKAYRFAALDALEGTSVRNLINISNGGIGAVRVADGSIQTYATDYSYFDIDVKPLATYTLRVGGATSIDGEGYGLVWLDIHNAVVGSAQFPFAAGQQLVAPAGAAVLRFSEPNTILATEDIVPGTTAPSVHLPYGRSPQSITLHTNGVRLGVVGDSFSNWFSQAWQNAVLARTGMSLVYQDARGSRRWGDAFECYNAAYASGANMSAPTYLVPNPAGIVTSSFYSTWWAEPNIGCTNGNTLAQNIANVDFLLLELGENDSTQNTPIGSLNDAVSAGTLYGNMRWVIQSYLTAKPTLRIAIISPTYRSDTSLSSQQAVVAAMKAFAESVACPYIDMFNRSLVSPLTAATYLSDGIHWTPTAFANIFGPMVAYEVMRLF